MAATITAFHMLKYISTMNKAQLIDVFAFTLVFALDEKQST